LDRTRLFPKGLGVVAIDLGTLDVEAVERGEGRTGKERMLWLVAVFIRT
jgi:hypothetical protein